MDYVLHVLLLLFKLDCAQMDFPELVFRLLAKVVFDQAVNIYLFKNVFLSNWISHVFQNWILRKWIFKFLPLPMAPHAYPD